MADSTTHHLTALDKELLIDWVDDIKRMSVKAKSAEYATYSPNESGDEFVVIDNHDAMLINEEANFFGDRRLLVGGGDDLLSNMTKIANEKGLDLQNYQCATCSTPIGEDILKFNVLC